MLKKNILLIFAPFVLAVILADISTPFLYRLLPSDFRRTQIILQALQQKTSPQTVLFGNSVLMTGVDASQLSASLHNQLIYNLGSSNQSLKEAFLFYPRLPASVTRVVQFVNAKDLSYPIQPLPEQTLRNFRMYAYEPDTSLYELIDSTELSYLYKSKWLVYLDARSILINSFNRQFRKYLRNDLQIDGAVENLFFPYLYTQQLPPEQYRNDIARNNPRSPLYSYTPDTKTLELLVRAKRYLAQRNISLVIALYPLNPDRFNYTRQYADDAFRKLNAEGEGLTIINGLNVLQPGDFIDHLHPNKQGARKLTAYLANQLE
jgi:hypothetical protein